MAELFQLGGETIARHPTLFDGLRCRVKRQVVLEYPDEIPAVHRREWDVAVGTAEAISVLVRRPNRFTLVPEVLETLVEAACSGCRSESLAFSGGRSSDLCE